MLTPLPRHYSVDGFVTNRYRLLCSIQIVVDLLHCSSVAMANRYISVLPPAEVTQSSSQIIIRIFHIIFSAVMLNILSALLTLRLLMSYIYGAPSKARNANVVYIWTYVWQR